MCRKWLSLMLWPCILFLTTFGISQKHKIFQNFSIKMLKCPTTFYTKCLLDHQSVWTIREYEFGTLFVWHWTYIMYLYYINEKFKQATDTKFINSGKLLQQAFWCLSLVNSWELNGISPLEWGSGYVISDTCSWDTYINPLAYTAACEAAGLARSINTQPAVRRNSETNPTLQHNRGMYWSQ